VRFHRAVAVVIQTCKLLVCPSKIMRSNLPWSSPLLNRFRNFSFFWGDKFRGVGGMSFLLGHTVLHKFILRFSKTSKTLGGEKKLFINILCPKPSTLQVKCLTVACVAVVSSVADCESLSKYTLMSHVYTDSSRSFWILLPKTFIFLGNVLPEDNPSLELYSYLAHWQMLRVFIEFSITLGQCVQDCQ